MVISKHQSVMISPDGVSQFRVVKKLPVGRLTIHNPNVWNSSALNERYDDNVLIDTARA
jgi:hypothetical protein